MSDAQKNIPEEPVQWGPMGGHATKPPQFLLDQAGNLTKLRDLLEGMVGQKQLEVQSLQEKLLRLKHGGGS